MNKLDISNITIGSKVFIVHNGYAYKNKEGGIVHQARVVSFINRKGIIEPEFRMIGQSGPNLSAAQYKVFTNIQEAIKAIAS